ncbi:MAG TPA: phenylacetate--CoA ligase [Kiritimatiellia bacterium]|jgi:phenylacetate-CoA ligase|nr:phenylacetate--CoA ligase [Kiritimatiellia bacterium]HOR98059.1 phenylacetate--CoA ligase [Kiritimatiellia bacterium]HPC49625.1 phenylacetate--CoA ligase [Kiritimatiellia bacterium]HPK37495.1 phenylacetate--CoA ligase [Kiritimatiellia bacterium]HPW74699.1 phenylacetate--CoA ligase [Kiritimatiellia bacterium]
MNTTPIVENRFWQPEFECMPRPRILALQVERLRETVARAMRVPFYRESFERKGITPDVIRSVEDVRRLPFTTKADFRDHYPLGLTAVPRSEIARFQGTSGTTGKPTWTAYTAADVDRWADLCARFLVSGGLRPEHTVQISFGFGLFTGGFGLHNGIQRVGAAVLPVSSGNAARQLMCMQDLQPEVLICTPSYALKLMDDILHGGVDRAALAIQHAHFGGEPWTEEIRERIETGLGIRCWNNYGMAECGGPGLSGECAFRNGMHIQEDQFIVETIDPETLEPLPDGEKGELVVTPLCREALPVVRYRTRDIGILYADGPCPCGRTTRRMSRILGRTDDMLIIRGVNVFPSQIETALMRFEKVAPHYMIEVTRPTALDEVTVHIEMQPGMFSDSMREMQGIRERIAAEIYGVTGLHMRVNLVSPNTLERFEGKSRRVKDLRKLVD